jgi:folate-dependent phosphoribosylglycinamide formyltransferase PurN
MLEKVDAEVSLVVVNDEEKGTTAQPTSRFGLQDIRNFARLFSSKGPWAFVLAVRKLVRWIEGFEPRWIQTVPVDSCDWVQGAEMVYTSPVPSRDNDLQKSSHKQSWVELSEDVVDRIADSSDVVIRFGFGLLEGQVLDATEHGVLSFHGTDIRKYRGLGTTERYLAGDTEAGATLQRLNPTVDGGQIVHVDYVDIGDLCHLEQMNERIHELQIQMLVKGIQRLQNPSYEPAVPENLGSYESLEKRGDWGYCLQIIAKEFRCLIKSHLN